MRTDHRSRAIWLGLAVCAALAIWLVRRGTGESVYSFSGQTMGGAYSVRLVHDLSPGEQLDVQDVVHERLQRVERLMSTYDTASELSRLNRHASSEPSPVSSELLDVLALAREVSERSGGALDVTVAPLVIAWGFGPGGDVDGPLQPPPGDSELAALRERVGYELIELDVAGGTVRKARPDAMIDVSALAKGYAADLVAAGLREIGLTRLLVDVGGELHAGGTGPRGRPWRVGIEVPDDDAGGIWGTVALADEGIATSGDYRDYYEEGGVRYAHIVDPSTGRPIPMRGLSATVVHARAAAADAWATALTVLGPERGMEVATREGLAALFLVRRGDDVESLLTPALAGRAETLETER